MSYLVTTWGWETAATGQLLVSRITGQVEIGRISPCGTRPVSVSRATPVYFDGEEASRNRLRVLGV